MYQSVLQTIKAKRNIFLQRRNLFGNEFFFVNKQIKYSGSSVNIMKTDDDITLEITEDPSCIIVYRGNLFTIYYNFEDEQSWIIFGKCSRCGKCLPDNWIEPLFRKDIPVRPEISKKIPECILIGEYV